MWWKCYCFHWIIFFIQKLLILCNFTTKIQCYRLHRAPIFPVFSYILGLAFFPFKTGYLSFLCSSIYCHYLFLPPTVGAMKEQEWRDCVPLAVCKWHMVGGRNIAFWMFISKLYEWKVKGHLTFCREIISEGELSETNWPIFLSEF